MNGWIVTRVSLMYNEPFCLDVLKAEKLKKNATAEVCFGSLVELSHLE